MALKLILSVLGSSSVSQREESPAFSSQFDGMDLDLFFVETSPAVAQFRNCIAGLTSNVST